MASRQKCRNCAGSRQNDFLFFYDKILIRSFHLQSSPQFRSCLFGSSTSFPQSSPSVHHHPFPHHLIGHHHQHFIIIRLAGGLPIGFHNATFLSERLPISPYLSDKDIIIDSDDICFSNRLFINDFHHSCRLY